VDKANLFKDRLGEDEHEIPGVGRVRFRGLQRGEALHYAKLVRKDSARAERFMLAKVLLDPVLTEEEVMAWQDATTSAEIEPIVRKVAKLSGAETSASADAYDSFRGEPGPGE
jgi:hypothetical protein